ncbi:MAG: beta-ketoacyl synthase N-terminal-like domain-containing protein [Myxococcota bacterium]
MRIWVTGVGIVSPLAASSRATLRRLHRAECAFGPVSLFDTAGQRAQIAAEVPNLRVRDVAPRGIDPATWSRTDAFAVAAAHEALTDARITPADRAVDLVVGTTTGATFETEERLADLLEDASRRPSFIPSSWCSSMWPVRSGRSVAGGWSAARVPPGPTPFCWEPHGSARGSGRACSLGRAILCAV